MKARNVDYNSYLYGLFNGCLWGAAYILLIASDINFALTWAFWTFILICMILGFHFFFKIGPKKELIDVTTKPMEYNLDLATKEYKKHLKKIKKLANKY